jgi:hypothetical protein
MLVTFCIEGGNRETMRDTAMRFITDEQTMAPLWGVMKMRFDSTPLLLRWLKISNSAHALCCVMISAFRKHDESADAWIADQFIETAVQRARVVAVASGIRLPWCAPLLDTTFRIIVSEGDAVREEHVQALWNISGQSSANTWPSGAVVDTACTYVLEHIDTRNERCMHISMQATRAVRSLLINDACPLEARRRVADAVEIALGTLVGRSPGRWSRARLLIAHLLRVHSLHGTALSVCTRGNEFSREVLVVDNATDMTITFEDAARAYFASVPDKREPSQSVTTDAQTVRIATLFKIERVSMNAGDLRVRLLERGTT